MNEAGASLVLDGHVARLAAVSLTDLNQQAALLARHDRKYVLPDASIRRLLAALPHDMRVLDIDGRQRFRYETLYFDTPDLRSFRDAVRGRPVRWKVRTRSYLDADEAWFEVKLRDRRGRTTKRRRPRCFYTRAQLGTDDRTFVDESGLTDLGELSPVLRTSYERVTLLEQSTASRLTIDLELRCSFLGGPSVGLAGAAIVETKTIGRASLADRALWAIGHRPVRFSKYGTGLAAVRPDLPSNRWHRTLRTTAWFPHEEAAA
jgi:hypothetical protein